eukprot:scaffold254226_cov36-Tisochrysis_lutea.AAC.1
MRIWRWGARNRSTAAARRPRSAPSPMCTAATNGTGHHLTSFGAEKKVKRDRQSAGLARRMQKRESRPLMYPSRYPIHLAATPKRTSVTASAVE